MNRRKSETYKRYRHKRLDFLINFLEDGDYTILKWCNQWWKASFFYISSKIITEYTWYTDNIVCILIIYVKVVEDMSLSTHRERYDFQRLFLIINHCMWMIWRGDTGNFFDLRTIWLWKDSRINPLFLSFCIGLITEMVSHTYLMRSRQ